ncbi:MAG: nuclear transport factor 2 family protein [Bacteroidota bacterium]
MKKSIILQSVLFLILFAPTFNPVQAQKAQDKVVQEITQALKEWNTATGSSNAELTMAQFDDSENIMVIGSDSGEIYKGKEQIRGWMTALYKNNSFSWEMNRVDIDYSGNTAWVFVDGKMVVSRKSGKIRKTPYRFTGILVKKGNAWKWRLFDGSVPASK